MVAIGIFGFDFLGVQGSGYDMHICMWPRDPFLGYGLGFRFFWGCVSRWKKSTVIESLRRAAITPAGKQGSFFGYWVIGYCFGFRIFSGACRDEISLLEK